jgi:uncharacterized protein (TIGR02757 family)
MPRATRQPIVGHPDLKDLLDRIYDRHNHRRFIAPDPLQFVYRYDRASDREAVGFLAAVLAYGRVEQIARDLEDLLARMGDHPGEFVLSFDASARQRLKGFKHRFTTGDDVADLVEVLSWAMAGAGSLEAFFLRGDVPQDPTLMPGLERFTRSLLERSASLHKGRTSRGLQYLLSRPSAGSACKRLNLFLRWMIRSDDVDPGAWARFDRRRLVVPLDVHMNRLCRVLGLHNRRTASLSAALQATRGFAHIAPDDPVKYDFSLCRAGMHIERRARISHRKRAGLSATDRYIYISFLDLLNKEMDI